MEIWICSQNKCVLCEAKGIWVEDESIYTSQIINGIPLWLGEYDSEVEALAVLDQIQGQVDLTRPESILQQGKVFQMPPAGFSTQPIELSYSERLSRERYLEFVSELEAEGDPDIPSEGQWRDELKAAIEAKEG
jgi:hypothetical protein